MDRSRFFSYLACFTHVRHLSGCAPNGEGRHAEMEQRGVPGILPLAEDTIQTKARKWEGSWHTRGGAHEDARQPIGSRASGCKERWRRLVSKGSGEPRWLWGGGQKPQHRAGVGLGARRDYSSREERPLPLVRGTPAPPAGQLCWPCGHLSPNRGVSSAGCKDEAFEGLGPRELTGA